MHTAVQYYIILTPTAKLSQLQNGVGAGVYLKYINYLYQYIVFHMSISMFVHACLCMGLEITIAFSWDLGSFNKIKISLTLKSLTFSLRTTLKQFYIGGAQHMKLVSSHDAESPFNMNCHSSFLLMKQPQLYLHCSTLKDADLASADTSAVCFLNAIDCLSILAHSPLTFVHSEFSTLFNVKIAHQIPKSQVEQVEIEMRNTQNFFLSSLKDKLADAAPED